MSRAAKERLVVVEDEPCARLGLEEMLKGWPHGRLLFTAESISAYEAGIARHGPPSLVLLDFKLPDGDAVRLLQRMQAAGQATRALVITARPEPRRAQAVLAAGACGILGKSATTVELRKALDDVRLTGHHHNAITQELVALAGKPWDAGDDREQLHAKLKRTLKGRKYQIFLLLLDPQGYTVREVAMKLGISLHTVEEHRKKIYELLGVHSRMELVLTAIRFGVLAG